MSFMARGGSRPGNGDSALAIEDLRELADSQLFPLAYASELVIGTDRETECLCI